MPGVRVLMSSTSFFSRAEEGEWVFLKTPTQRWGRGKGRGRQGSAGEGAIMVGQEEGGEQHTAASHLLGTAELWLPCGRGNNSLDTLITSLFDNAVLT